MADELPRNVLHYIFPEPADYEHVYDEKHPKDDFDYEEDDEGGNCLSWPIFLAGAALWVAILGLIWLAILVTVAHAHEAPTGWRYPFACCHNQDCREVPDDAIGERPDGYVIKRTGEVLSYGDARLKDSPDGRHHWCSVAGHEDSRTICLFVPPRSY